MCGNDTYALPTPWLPKLDLATWLLPRILELTYTAWDLAPFARDLGWEGPPFRWDEERRFQLRAELDAAFFHLYGIERDDVAYIMETFWIVRNNDVKAHGHYRTKEAILDRYDAMQQAIDTGAPYQTVLGPPPAHPDVTHAPLEPAAPRYVLPDLTTLAPAAWAIPRRDPSWETVAILAAILKQLDGPTASRRVRLAATLALEPPLLVPIIPGAEAATWQRLVGPEAGQASGTVDRAWGEALAQLRGRRRLVEDTATDTWAPGPDIDAIATRGWPDGRAAFVLQQMERLGLETVLNSLPEMVRRSLDVAAA